MDIRSLEALDSVWANVDSGVDRLRFFRELDGNDYIRVIIIDIVNAMNQSLVQVEDDCLRLVWSIWLREVYTLILDLVEGWGRELEHLDVVQSVHCLIEVDLLHIRLLIILIFSLRVTVLALFVCILLLVDVVFVVVWVVSTAVVLLIR